MKRKEALRKIRKEINSNKNLSRSTKIATRKN
jgi:hypothetical protein